MESMEAESTRMLDAPSGQDAMSSEIPSRELARTLRRRQEARNSDRMMRRAPVDVRSFFAPCEGMTPDEVDTYLNKKSGVLGLSGLSSDFRDLEEAGDKGNERAQLAIDVFAYTVRKYIGSYAAAMGGVDAIVFTAGLGENSPRMRDQICNGLEFLGTRVDAAKNAGRGKEQEISVDGSKVKIFVIPTNEELVIARDTKTICSPLVK